MKNNVTSPYRTIDGLQSIPRESNDKDVAAMLDELTIEAGEESFVIAHQCGGNGVTCKRSIYCTQCLIGRRRGFLYCPETAGLISPIILKRLC